MSCRNCHDTLHQAQLHCDCQLTIPQQYCFTSITLPLLLPVSFGLSRLKEAYRNPAQLDPSLGMRLKQSCSFFLTIAIFPCGPKSICDCQTPEQAKFTLFNHLSEDPNLVVMYTIRSVCQMIFQEKDTNKSQDMIYITAGGRQELSVSNDNT